MAEEHYDSVLVIKYTSYGTDDHKRKEAAAIKRALQVNLHNRDIEVFLVEDEGEEIITLTCNKVTWDALLREVKPDAKESQSSNSSV